MKFLPVGSQIVCPNEECGLIIAEAVEVLRSGEKILSSKFKAVNFPLEPHTKMECTLCGSAYGQKILGCGEIHTAKGWI